MEILIVQAVYNAMNNVLKLGKVFHFVKASVTNATWESDGIDPCAFQK